RADLAEHRWLRRPQHRLCRRMARRRARPPPPPPGARRAGRRGGALSAMDDSVREFNRRLFFTPDLFPPLSAIVHAELGARSRRGEVHPTNCDHYLVLKLGRSQETVLTSLPPEAIANRFEEYAYGMVLADGMGALGQVASGLAVAAMLQLV